MKFLVLIFLVSIFTVSLSAQDKKATLTVELKNVKIEGTLYLTLYNKDDGYPTDSTKAFAKNMKKVTAVTEKVVFKDIPFGTYAVSVWHDQNDNQKMEKSLIGIPKEGMGVSNDAKGKMGPPKFKDAKFVIDKEKTEISITLRY
ncbi:MAG TPA: DUF2141 domain-containing protein, partial [bacterium]|nr:DUF2141 domain-containing protein [bacterium]